ncbi:hypothetical protein [Streptomyces hygroscopicus]|nr:hypothetical protein [Streptomyces hygroscopicus]
MSSGDAVELIRLAGRGLPRSVGSVARRSLVAALVEDRGIVRW